MARILLVVAALAVTIFAVADWASRSRTWTPGRINRWVWLAVIVLLPIIGPLAWIITGLVTRAEGGGPAPQAAPPRVSRPDDDPTAISDLADRIARREKRTRPGRPSKPPEELNGEDEDGTEQKAR